MGRGPSTRKNRNFLLFVPLRLRLNGNMLSMSGEQFVAFRQKASRGMQPEKIYSMWSDYRSRGVNETVDKDDHMYNTAQKPADYFWVGESGLQVVMSILMASPTKAVNSILDFGCGHGRVGRYLRAYFPDAKMTFADVDRECVKFCCGAFAGKGYETPHNFGELQFEDKYDLIWLGSVFTHIDYERMKLLFDKLFASLATAGVVIGTFRGNKMYQTYLRNPEVAARDMDLIKEFEEHGVAYKRYPNLPYDWGLSLVSPFRLIAIGERNPEARLVAYTEVGWANAHDVAAWTNVSPATIIR
jgi:SAM-dependent methyltransferase